MMDPSVVAELERIATSLDSAAWSLNSSYLSDLADEIRDLIRSEVE